MQNTLVKTRQRPITKKHEHEHIHCWTHLKWTQKTVAIAKFNGKNKVKTKLENK